LDFSKNLKKPERGEPKDQITFWGTSQKENSLKLAVAARSLKHGTQPRKQKKNREGHGRPAKAARLNWSEKKTIRTNAEMDPLGEKHPRKRSQTQKPT